MNAGERRRAILEVMCLRRHETRANLAFEFGVSKRTIENDVLLLSLEYPIYTSQGYGGGIHMMEGFRLERSMTNKELALLQKLSFGLEGEEKRMMQSLLNRFGKGGRL